MNLVNENGQPLNTDKKLLDASGDEVNAQPERQMTTADIGAQLASHLINAAMKFPNNDLVNTQFDVLYYAALNLLSHRVVNVGLGMEAGNLVAEWDASRAFAQEKQVQEHLSVCIEDWKNQFFNGELAYHPSKTL